VKSCVTGSLTEPAEEFLGTCGPEVLQLAPVPSVDDKNSNAAGGTLFVGLEEKYWYTIAGGVIFLGLVIAVVWGVRKKNMPEMANASMTSGKVVLGAGYAPVSPTNMPQMMGGGMTPNYLVANSPYSMGRSPRSPGDYQEASQMQSFFPSGGVPPRMMSNESMLSQGSANGMSMWQYLEAKDRGQSSTQVRSPLVSRDVDGVALILACATQDAEIYFTVDKTVPVPPSTSTSTSTSNSPGASLYVGSAEGAKQGALNAVRQVLRDNQRASNTAVAVAGSGTHRYDTRGPNNLLRIAEESSGAPPLEVRCIAVKNGMAASHMVTHVDRKDGNESHPRKSKPPPLNLAPPPLELGFGESSFETGTNL